MCERSMSPLAVRTVVAACTISCSWLDVDRLMTWKVPNASAAACAARWSCPPGSPTMTRVLRAMLADSREKEMCALHVGVTLYSDPVRHIHSSNYCSRKVAMPAEQTYYFLEADCRNPVPAWYRGLSCFRFDTCVMLRHAGNSRRMPWLNRALLTALHTVIAFASRAPPIRKLAFHAHKRRQRPLRIALAWRALSGTRGDLTGTARTSAT